MIKKIALLFSFLFACLFSFAQNNEVPMADGLRSDGKIFVVVAVIVTIFAGIILYLIRLDKKLTKLEKNHFNS